MKIDISEWKEFKIDKLFRVERPIARSQASYDDGDVPFVASGNFDNGVLRYCNPSDDEILDKGNCISVSPIDGSSFYQPVDFLGRGGAGSSILLLYNDNLNKYIGEFIVSVMRRAFQKYSYIDALSGTVIKAERILLPSADGKEPDWKYMEEYIKKIEGVAERHLKALQNAKDKQKKMDTSSWGDFVIGDLFEKLQLQIKKQDFNKVFDVSEERTPEFNLPLINAKHGNNGIMYYGREEDFEYAEMTIDIVQNGAIATGDVYAQPQRTGVLWDAYLIKPLIAIESSNVLLFLSTVIERAIKHKFSYDDKCIWDKAKLLTIKLPVTVAGEPDLEYMDMYMNQIRKEAANNSKVMLSA